MKSLYFILSLLLCLLNETSAQKKCKDVLNRSDKLFQEGQIQEAVKTCEPCIKSLKSEEEKFEAYRLMGISYQFLNNPKKTLHYVELMIQMKPDYQKYPNIDPVEFTQIVNRFEVKPVLYIGVLSGMTYNHVSLGNSYAVYNSTQSYANTTGYQLGIFSEYKPGEKLSYTAELNFEGASISQQIDNAGGSQQNYQESQQYISLIPGVRYYQNIGNRLKAYGGASLGLHFLTGSLVNFETRLNTNNEVVQVTKDATDERTRIQFSGILRAGLSANLGKGILSVEIYYRQFFRNLIDPSLRMNDMNFIFNNQYINDDMYLSTGGINFIYSMPIHWKIEMK